MLFEYFVVKYDNVNDKIKIINGNNYLKNQIQLLL